MSNISHELEGGDRKGIEVTKQELRDFSGLTDSSILEKQRRRIEIDCDDCSLEWINWEEKEGYGHGWCCCVS